MDEKTKELKTIDDLETVEEEKTPTKKLDTISEEEILKDENLEEKEEQVEEHVVEEIKEDNIKEEPKKEKEKISKKKIFIIIGISVAVIIILLVAILLLLKPKKEETTKKEIVKYTEYGETIYKSLEDGNLDKVIKDNLEKNNIKVNTVTLLNMDLDSDNRQDLVVFASDNTNKMILILKVKDVVSYGEYYKLDSKDSIGYLFNKESEKFFWYVENNNRIYPIDKHSSSITKEDLNNNFNYYLITNKYKNEQIIEYGLKYNFNKKLDIKELEEKAITNKEMQSDIKISIDEIKKELDNKEAEYSKKQKEEYEKNETEKNNNFKKDFPLETAKKVLEVSLTNYNAKDVRDEENRFDKELFHDSTYDGEFKAKVTTEGTWEVATTYSRHWQGKNIVLTTSQGDIKVTSCEIFDDNVFYTIKTIIFNSANKEYISVNGFTNNLDGNEYLYLKVPKTLIK